MKLIVTLLAAFTLLSPDSKTSVQVEFDKNHDLCYSVSVDGKQVLCPSPAAITLEDGSVWGAKGKLLKIFRRSVDRTNEVIAYKRSQVRENFNELNLVMNSYGVTFRAYNDGVAYRFYYRGRGPITVVGETARFNFPEDYDALVPFVRTENPVVGFEPQFDNSFENIYTASKTSALSGDKLAFNPVLFSGSDVRICIAEADLRAYPGMYLNHPEGTQYVEGVFAAYPDSLERGGYNGIQMLVKSRKPYIAKMEQGQDFPWRVIGIARQDKDLLASDLVYNLAAPADPETDWSWVKPGMTAWEWWNDWSLRGVPFRAGVNNRTYEYYIDFAAAFNIPYVLMDDGWSVKGKCDLLSVVPEIDIPHLVKYAADRGVGIFLWAGYYPFDRDLEKVCRHYSEMGVKGFKVDFFNRDDQYMVEFLEKAAATAAKYHLMLDFHGVFKPSGIQRTYPNVLNFEGVYGLENMKWAEDWRGQPDYDVQLPFIRQYAGPMDYTPGAMKNASYQNWHAVHSEPQSQGTRCHQIATYVIFDQPLAMMADTPSNYYAEPLCSKFIAGIPTVWDETLVIDGKIGKYAVMARRSGDVWYLGALGGWDDSARSVKLDFLGEGEWQYQMFYDGPNAGKVGSDFLYEEGVLTRESEVNVTTGPGGGWVAKFVRK